MKENYDIQTTYYDDHVTLRIRIKDKKFTYNTITHVITDLLIMHEKFGDEAVKAMISRERHDT